MTEGEERLAEGEVNESHVGQKAIDSAKSFGGECNSLEPCSGVLSKKKKDVLHLHSLFIMAFSHRFLL